MSQKHVEYLCDCFDSHFSEEVRLQPSWADLACGFNCVHKCLIDTVSLCLSFVCLRHLRIAHEVQYALRACLFGSASISKNPQSNKERAHHDRDHGRSILTKFCGCRCQQTGVLFWRGRRGTCRNTACMISASHMRQGTAEAMWCITTSPQTTCWLETSQMFCRRRMAAMLSRQCVPQLATSPRRRRLCAGGFGSL